MKRVIFISLLLLSYLSIGFIFTILRANAHYEYIVEIPRESKKSYWEERCVEENREKVHATPGAYWCEDSSGNFHVDKPTKYEWYFYFYSKQKSDFPVTLLLWPLHFLGFNMIDFRSVANVI